MLLAIGGVGEFLLAVKVGFLLVCVAAIGLIIVLETFTNRSRGGKPVSFREDLRGAFRPGGRFWGVVAGVVVSIVVVNVLLAFPSVLMVVVLHIPLFFLLALGCAMRPSFLGRAACVAAVAGLVLVPMAFRSEWENPFLVYGASGFAAVALAVLLVLGSRRANAAEGRWALLEERVRAGVRDASEVGGIQGGDRLRRRRRMDSVEQAERVKAKGMYFRIP
jgi:hypothetical protein